MERKRVLVVGIIGLLLAIGLALIGCDDFFDKKEEGSCSIGGSCSVEWVSSTHYTGTLCFQKNCNVTSAIENQKNASCSSCH